MLLVIALGRGVFRGPQTKYRHLLIARMPPFADNFNKPREPVTQAPYLPASIMIWITMIKCLHTMRMGETNADRVIVGDDKKCRQEFTGWFQACSKAREA